MGASWTSCVLKGYKTSQCYCVATICFCAMQPQWPWNQKSAHKGPPFFPVDEVLSVLVAAVMGLQHALAMVGGIVTPPLIIGFLQDDPEVANCK